MNHDRETTMTTDNRYDELPPLLQRCVSGLINSVAANGHVDVERLADVVNSATDAVRDAGSARPITARMIAR